MGIWIRSQSRCSTIKAIYFFANGNTIACSDQTCRGTECFEVGEYSSKEKALKVLDMIQEHIEESGKQTVQTNEDEWMRYNADVFQIPQDSEVEV